VPSNCMRLSVKKAACQCLVAAGLRAFNDAIVAFRAGTECLKCFLVSLAFVGREGDIIAVEFDNDGPQLQPGFVGLNLARGFGQCECDAVSNTGEV